jgi:hypothetical protein
MLTPVWSTRTEAQIDFYAIEFDRLNSQRSISLF